MLLPLMIPPRKRTDRPHQRRPEKTCMCDSGINFLCGEARQTTRAPRITFVILNVNGGGVKDLLYLPFSIGALSAFTIGISGGDALHAAFPLRKAAHSGCWSGPNNCENTSL